MLKDIFKKPKKAVMVGVGLVGITIGTFVVYRIGCQHGVNITHDALKVMLDEETWDKVNTIMKNV